MTNMGFTSSTYNFTTNNNNIVSLDYGDVRVVDSLHFWSGADLVSDSGMETKNITISGVENINPYVVMAGIDNVVEAGDIITLWGMKNSALNVTWVIESFSYEPISPRVVQWTLNLEKYY